MPDKTWKAVERRIARQFGTERTGPQGRAVSDVITGEFSIEVKTRKLIPLWLHAAMDQAERNAVENTMPVVVLHQVGQRSDHDLVVMSLAMFRKLRREK